MGQVTPDDVLAALDPEQREVAQALQGPVCVLAGAGTGKTRAITHRLAYGVLSGVWSPRSLLAVTFTARAAGQMRGRLRELGVTGVQARTFHATALRQLTYFWPRVVGGDLPRISDRKVPLIREAAGRLRIAQAPAALRDLAAEIEWAKVTRTAPEDYARVATSAGRAGPAGLDLVTVGRIYGGYEDVKRAGGLIDFEDVLLLTVAALEDRPDVAEEVRAVYRHITVDEYQDVNPLQQRLLELWLGDRTDVCVVGDASQTIYSFTGASPSYLLGFRRRWPQARLVRLVRDYRSTPEIVALANGLLARARGVAAEARLELVAQRPPGPEPTFTAHDDEPGEAAAVATRIRTLIGAGVPASEIAILYRVNAQSEVYEAALTEAKVPYVLRGAERFFERSEVREAVIRLRGAARAGAAESADTESATLGAPSASLRDEVAAVLSGAGWDAASPPAGGASRERWESLAAIVRLAEDVAAAQAGAGLRDLINEIDERTAAQHAPTIESVTLASLHAAKGLEWDAVFLVGLAEGTMPIVHADTPEAVEEERRLLYVGVTRAREHLALSWASSRSPGGSRTRRPSRFLDGLRPEVGVAAAPARVRSRGPANARRTDVRCHSCGTTLISGTDRKRGRCEGCPPAYDEELFDRLRSWRLERSRADSVPAFVVLTDATLEAVATRKPDKAGVLATIPGIGATKLGRYGEALLDLVAGRPVSVERTAKVTEP
jgi:DNA helicase II / ATP-dependent DNA helicase PcrA